MCTIFGVNGPTTTLLAKNYDSFIQKGMIFTNCRGMKKISLVMPPEKSFEWIAEFGSITFSQSGKGMPVSGMNEKGLIVEQATLPETIYPVEDERAAISCLEATQYILDTCDSTDKAINAFSNFRISRTAWTIHFYFCDKNGEMAIVEFNDGDMQIYRDDTMPVNILTNSNYSLLCRSLKTEEIFPTNEYQANSIKRFKCVSNGLKAQAEIEKDDAFAILDKAKREDTAWSCVFDLQDKKIYFNSVYNEVIRCIDFNAIDFSQTAKSYLYDLETTEADFKFVPYSRELNRKNIADFFGNEFIINLMHLPNSDFMIDAFDNHAEKIESGIL